MNGSARVFLTRRGVRRGGEYPDFSLGLLDRLALRDSEITREYELRRFAGDPVYCVGTMLASHSGYGFLFFCLYIDKTGGCLQGQCPAQKIQKPLTITHCCRTRQINRREMTMTIDRGRNQRLISK
jgi:hypothetical protein